MLGKKPVPNKFVKPISILFFLVLFWFGFNQFLISVLGKGYIFYLPNGSPWLILGNAKYVPKSHLVPYPPRVQAAFGEEKASTNGHFYYREPKYEKEVKILSIDGDTVHAKDFYTEDPIDLAWSKSSGYGCYDRPIVYMGDQIIDPSQDPKGMKFVFFGKGWRGILGAEGMSFLLHEYQPGDTAKIYLVSDEKDQNNRYEIMNLVLFKKDYVCFDQKQIQVEE
jgi:hypothetical protein